MAGHFSHAGGPPGAGDDPDIMALPPRVRPFIPERYNPPTHVLPQAVFYYFTDFDDRAPGDLLLREPESHLSHEAREVTSRIAREYGSVAAREWYTELPEAVWDLVDLVGFRPFYSGISRCLASRTLMGALVERWWDTTNSFHFSATGDMTMTPFDFAVLTGLDMGGWAIPYDEDMGQWEAAWIYLLGARPPVDRSSGRVQYTWFSSHFRRVEMEPEAPEEVAQYTRGFLMFLFGTTLFANRGNTVGLYLLSALVDLSQVRRYDWGGASLATLYCYISATSRGRGNILGGYWRACELWIYAYFPTLVPKLEVAMPPMTPYSLVFEGPYRPRPRESFLYLRQYFDTVRPSEITWQPWAPLGRDLRFQFAEAWGASRYRILLEGPVGRAWFLGERFLCQTWGYLVQDIPSAPPDDMRTADRLPPRGVVDARLGTDAFLHLEQGEYATYRHTYLMPSLTGVHTPMRRPAGMPSSGRARAADVPSTSRAGTSRGGGGLVSPIPPTHHHPGWPDMPTELTGWRFRTLYLIPIEPPMFDHKYVKDPDSPRLRSSIWMRCSG
ncbi:protein MAINTENANCE OF MERISTEMS-like [Camellia sinensis]|uniref:protein MAINTENANCE OF MERISTEMS-like n=1 Tax=Camellia sinensis TaxID=4442 RepID=UPI001036F331|nr:protein MAINTENANCE OF MERISTEMS-like [Camellia sinensis]